MQRCKYISSLVAAVLLLGAANAAGIEVKPNAITEHDYRKALVEFYQRTLAQPYHTSAHRNPRWDAAAQSFLDALAIHRANLGARMKYEVKGDVGTDKLVTLGKSALDAGCDDPLVQYGNALMLLEKHQTKEAAPFLQKSINEMLHGHYPLTCVLDAAQKLGFISPTKAQQQAAAKQFWDAALAILTSWKFQGMDRRIILHKLWDGGLEQVPLDFREGFCKAARQLSSADPWLVKNLDGRCEIDQAWNVRGSGFADSVNSKGWEGLAEHMGKARQSLQAAWDLDHSAPEPAASMITVAMAASDNPLREMRTWFDRAVSAQFDYDPAYFAYRWGLRPRWHGDYDQMYRFGVECLKTGRYDTLVPNELLTVLHDIADDDGDEPNYYYKPGVYDSLNELFASLASANHGNEREWYWKGYQVAYAWRTGHFDEARKLLDAMKPHSIAWSACDELRIPPLLVLSHIYAMTGAHAKSIQAAEQLTAPATLPQAIDAYQRIVAAVKPGDNDAMFIRGRAAELKWMRDYLAGKWVSIQPDEQFDGWPTSSDIWHYESDGSLIARPISGYYTMPCQAGFLGSSYEIEFTIDMPNSPVQAGIVFAPHDEAFRISRADQQAIHTITAPIRATVGASNRVSIRVERDESTIKLNDQAFFENAPTGYPAYYVRRLTLGVWAYGPLPAGTTVRFSNLRIRQIRAVNGSGASTRPASGPRPEETQAPG